MGKKKKKPRVKKSSPMIELVDNYQGPRSICQHCKNVMVMDIEPFKKDITKPIESNCPRCGGKIYSALLILTQTSLPGLMQCIQIVAEALKPGNFLKV